MKDVIAFLAAIVGGLFALLFSIGWLLGLLTFPGDLAQIEQLRRDAAHVDPIQAEDTIGQVTQWNQTIRSNQAYDRMFIIGIMVPDGWQDVQPIEVPQQ